MKRKDIDELGEPGPAYNQLFAEAAPKGKILAVGDSARKHAILNMPYFKEHKHLIYSQALNIDESHCGVFDHFEVKHGDANFMPQFEDGEFDCVISVMMLEHNPKFWLSLAEMKRVLKTNGMLIIVTPGYSRNAQISPLVKSNDSHPWGLVYGCHGDPDCYRFSEHFYKYVVFEDFKDYVLVDVLTPPRLFGIGVK